MPRNRLTGWINLDKPVGPTSRDCVSAVRRITGAAKCGHAGTLDPLASGILPIALGEATKSLPYLVAAPKSYTFTIRWGEQRSTDDAEGEIIAASEARPERPDIESALQSFRGAIQQRPPTYSAIKVGGRRAYDLARRGEPVVLPARPILIHQFDLVGMPDRDHAVFAVSCAKGAYMRSLARDLALAVGTVGYMAALRRTAVGGFQEAGAISLAKLEELGNSAAAEQAVLPLEAALADIPALVLTAREAQLLRNGQAIPLLRGQDRERIQEIGDDAIVLAKEADTPVAFARVEGMCIRPVRVLNL